MLKLYDLTVEYKTAPLGMDEAHPRFSWKLQSDRMNTRQSAYQIKVTEDRGLFFADFFYQLKILLTHRKRIPVIIVLDAII